MQEEFFDFEIEKLKKEIGRYDAKKILLQLPEGFKSISPKLASKLEAAGFIVVISGDPCYGACDLPLQEAQVLGIDLIIHYGHSKSFEIRKPSIPVIFLEAKAKMDILESIDQSLEHLKKWKRIGLATNVQHVHTLSKVKRNLENYGKKIYVGKFGQTYAGQILGCDCSSAKMISSKVEAFVFFGGGRFHALGLALATMKPTIVIDPFEKRTYSIENEVKRIIRMRWANIIEARKAKTFGILIGLKTGQTRFAKAIEIGSLLRKNGKKTVFLASREIDSKRLLQFPTIDAYINTACPRIFLANSSVFSKPFLVPREVYVMLGKTKWMTLLRNGFF